MTHALPPRDSYTFLIADDDADDRLMIREAAVESKIHGKLHFVEDGEELTDYLHRRGKYASADQSPRPDLILLDLHMPKKDGRQALREIKSNPALRGIPIIALTTSKLEADIEQAYDFGVNSFITKPVSFGALVTMLQSLAHYWFNVVKLPNPER